MKFIKKFVPVMLSLAMCASMVAPAFAASFGELQGVIDSKESLLNDAGDVRIGYEGGTVTLNEKVERTNDEAGKSITVSGKDNNVTIDLNGYTIDGNDKTGSVIKVTDGASLTIEDSGENGTITGGNAILGGNDFGGGVYVEDAELTLNGGTITGNTANDGGGVAVKGGTVTMNDGAVIDGNTGNYAAGGVFMYATNDNDAYFTMNGGTISNNTTGGYGGGIGTYPMNDESRNQIPDGENHIIMNGGTITGNHADSDVGGGVSIRYGDFTMNDGVISDNTAATLGGGIHSYYADTTITGGTISGNTAGKEGGGVFLFGQGNVSSMTGGTITGNTADYGGGVALDVKQGTTDGTTFNMSGGEISDNTATKYGGGVYGMSGTFNMSGKANISGNTANLGGGVFSQNSNVTMDSGKINDNHAASGGGVYNFSNSTFTMNNGEISDNVVTGSGGGIYNDKATFTMNNGEISRNEATSQGGGIYANGKSGNTVVNMYGGTIADNSATYGGGVRLALGATLTMMDGSITGNHASVDGGGVYSYNGTTFTMNGGEITENTAARHGGGVFSHTADLTMTDGKIYDNSADVTSDDIYGVASGYQITLITAESMGAEIDGETVNRWLWDSSAIRSEDGYSIWSLTGDAVLYLKAAPAQMFTVTVSDGYSSTPILNQDLERNTLFPEITEPTRPGYAFAGWSMELPELVNGEINLVAQWEPIPEIEIPGGNDTEIEIEDTAIPLASGPVTRAEFVDYLWRHEGQPAPVADSGLFEDVTEEHELSPAMAWAKSVGLIEAYEDGTFEPDELVTVGAVRSILDNFARVFGTNAVAAADLKSLTGDEDEAVLNCDEVLAEFFGEEIEIAA